jgi:phosphate/sulfate permease
MTLLIVVVVLALIFDFINGFHDAANSIATVVSTRVLSPLTAVIWAAGFNFLAYWIFELKVAETGPYHINCCNFRTHRGHYLEFTNVVVGYSVKFIPYTHRRLCGCRISKCRFLLSHSA